MPEKTAAVVLAAGLGKRMRSRTPKVLHPLLGQPMLAYPLQASAQVGCEQQVVIVGHGKEQVKEHFARADVVWAEQEQLLGTGHALACSQPALENFQGTLLVLCGDVPLLRPETLMQLLETHQQEEAAVTLLTATVDNPAGYGRVLRENKRIAQVIEEADATVNQHRIREINSGIYAVAAPWVFHALSRLQSDNAQQEYYLPDIVPLALADGYPVTSCSVAAVEVQGVNDRVQLSQATQILRQRVNQKHLEAGVTMEDPQQTYIEPQVEIEADTCLEAGVHLRGQTRIGGGCHIATGAVLTDCVLADDVTIKPHTVCTQAHIGTGCDIGPMAHLRPGTQLAGQNKVGNFVEMKQAAMEQGSKASHLTYLGDAQLGAEVNVGCGTITCNYDGQQKHQTVIEDGAFIGSDVQLVAPVRVGAGALVAAGATITKDVPADALAISRARQKNLPGWVSQRRQKDRSGEGGG